MKVLYFISVKLYVIAINIAALFKPKAAKMIAGRKNWRTKIKAKIDSQEKYVWVHCASLGEFEQARPLIEKIKNNLTVYKIFLSFFSPSGYEIQKNYKYADAVVYLPFDSKKNAKDFILTLKPAIAIFVKYEFWYYYINELKKQKIPTYLVSAVFRESHVFFKKYASFYRGILTMYETIFVQDEKSAKILKKHGINNFEITGDTRIDRVIEIAEQYYSNSFIEKFLDNKFIIVAGSTWPADEKIICEFINNNSTNYKLIIAPHEVHEDNLNRLEKELTVKSCRLSESETQNAKDVSVVIIDSIGILSKIYRYGHIAYVGGGFGKGIHNILEAAVYRIPVIFGPNHTKFIEANNLIEYDSAFYIKNSNDFYNILKRIMKNPDEKNRIDNQLKRYFDFSAGSSNRIFSRLSQKNGV